MKAVDKKIEKIVFIFGWCLILTNKNPFSSFQQKFRQNNFDII